MIVDCHGHYTTTPAAHAAFRQAQLARLADPSLAVPTRPEIADEDIRTSVEDNQLAFLRERGGDLMIFSPQASAMAHHVPDEPTAVEWAQASNDLVHRVTRLFPEHFAAACQLPQTPGGDLGPVVDELRRCVERLGFVGANVNPDPSVSWTFATARNSRRPLSLR